MTNATPDTVAPLDGLHTDLRELDEKIDTLLEVTRHALSLLSAVTVLIAADGAPEVDLGPDADEVGDLNE